MIFVDVVTIIGGPEEWNRRAKRMIGESLAVGVRFWHSRFLKRHFAPGASGLYSYAKRSDRYLARKARVSPNAPDLVYSGRLRRVALRFINVTPRGPKAIGRFVVPSYAAIRRRFSSGPALPRELTATTPQELSAMGEIIRKDLAIRLTKNPTRRVIRLAA